MESREYEELEEKRICYCCVGDEFLSDEIRREGKRAECSYCGEKRRTYSIGEMADRVEAVFEEHYSRTSDQPNSWQLTLLSDRESSYDWEREGEPVVEAIQNSADLPEEAATDIQQILEDRHYDFDLAKIGEESEFSSETYYDQKGATDREWQAEWGFFEHLLKTEARFFSRVAVEHLTAVFGDLDELQTRDGRSLITGAGPSTGLETLYRARVFQSTGPLQEALGRPDLQLGSPPARLARAGRMNAAGISVFYGATDATVAVTEVRPPVGSKVLVGRFTITRPLRLLDLTALGSVASGGSVYDPALSSRLSKAMFLRSLSERMTRPVMPDDEIFEYLPTQAIADFLATEVSTPLDGIIFPSAQAEGEGRNVVLFHKAAKVAELEFPEGTEIKARTGQVYDEGWETEYTVIEEVPPTSKTDDGSQEEEDELGLFGMLRPTSWVPADPDVREVTLSVDLDTIRVHHVQRVQYSTERHYVMRHRWEKRVEEGFWSGARS